MFPKIRSQIFKNLWKFNRCHSNIISMYNHGVINAKTNQMLVHKTITSEKHSKVRKIFLHFIGWYAKIVQQLLRSKQFCFRNPNWWRPQGRNSQKIIAFPKSSIFHRHLVSQKMPQPIMNYADLYQQLKAALKQPRHIVAKRITSKTLHKHQIH